MNTGVSRFNAWVSPDESLLIIPTVGRPETLGGTDYFLSRRDDDGRWLRGPPARVGVNGRGVHEYSASLGPDGKQLFFMSQRVQGGRPFFGTQRTRARLVEAHHTPGLDNPTVYWIDASALDATGCIRRRETHPPLRRPPLRAASADPGRSGSRHPSPDADALHAR